MYFYKRKVAEHPCTGFAAGGLADMAALQLQDSLSLLPPRFTNTVHLRIVGIVGEALVGVGVVEVGAVLVDGVVAVDGVAREQPGQVDVD